MILFGTGAGLTWQQDIRRHSNWFGNFYRDSDYVIVKVDEAPIDKPKSFKATCVVEGIMRVDSFMPMEGKLLVYFSKDSASQQLRYGDRIIIHKNLQRIRNSGNPGAFDYEQYAAFQQLFHNVFLKNNDWIPLNKNDANVFTHTSDQTIEDLTSNIYPRLSLVVFTAYRRGCICVAFGYDVYVYHDRKEFREAIIHLQFIGSIGICVALR